MCSEHKVVSEVDKTKGHIQSLHLYPKVLIKRTYRIRLGHLLIFTTVEYIFFSLWKQGAFFVQMVGYIQEMQAPSQEI